MNRDPATVDRDAGDEAGFTLVELLVALALFSLLTTLLFDNVRFGLRAWQNGGANAEQFERSMISQEFLRRTIGNLYPMIVADGTVQPHVDFDGTKDAIGFLGNAPIVSSGGGRFRFKVFVERRGDQADLIVAATPELAPSNDSSTTTKTLLLSDIDRAEFSYLGMSAAEQSPRWSDNWTKRNDMPRLVRLRIAFRSGDTRLWPELLIAPRVLADVNCIYDPITMRCRGR